MILKNFLLLYFSLSLSLSLLDSTINCAWIKFKPKKQNPKISLSLSNFNSSQTQKKFIPQKKFKKITHKSFLLFLQEFDTKSKTQTSFSTINCVYPQKNTRVFIAIAIITLIIFPFRFVADSGFVFFSNSHLFSQIHYLSSAEISVGHSSKHIKDEAEAKADADAPTTKFEPDPPLVFNPAIENNDEDVKDEPDDNRFVLLSGVQID